MILSITIICFSSSIYPSIRWRLAETCKNLQYFWTSCCVTSIVCSSFSIYYFIDFHIAHICTYLWLNIYTYSFVYDISGGQNQCWHGMPCARPALVQKVSPDANYQGYCGIGKYCFSLREERERPNSLANTAVNNRELSSHSTVVIILQPRPGSNLGPLIHETDSPYHCTIWWQPMLPSQVSCIKICLMRFWWFEYWYIYSFQKYLKTFNTFSNSNW